MMVAVSSRQLQPPPALIAEATKRAGLIWVEVPGAGPARPAWHVWHGDAAYLLTGPGEQPLPAIADGDRVTVLVPSKDSRGLLVTWEAEAARVAPGGTEWQQVTGLLATGRLNAAPEPGGPPLSVRWAQTCTVYRLAVNSR